jgi:hypothetical protein
MFYAEIRKKMGLYLEKCLWTLLGSNQRPYACEAYALNQLS